ncbi:hypothetical protein [Streptomyces qinglanensis]|uniref:Uncharacterized protein n=1 Tax=Streptomyces qinglanensis TaxID=943816 RepID=A0A1H9U4H0_9ACTN|nr:hypothetical protein [Streptomyces qinglanensis]SES04064.1 hypothetical protein SAMN05421870_107299 [Streptomyces qinglanensis]
MTTAYDRLLAEEIPIRPTPPPHTPQPADYHSAWTEAEQAQHRADLLAALDAHHAHIRHRHLHAIPEQDAA